MPGFLSRVLLPACADNRSPAHSFPVTPLFVQNLCALNGAKNNCFQQVIGVRHCQLWLLHGFGVLTFASFHSPHHFHLRSIGTQWRPPTRPRLIPGTEIQQISMSKQPRTAIIQLWFYWNLFDFIAEFIAAVVLSITGSLSQFEEQFLSRAYLVFQNWGGRCLISESTGEKFRMSFLGIRF